MTIYEYLMKAVQDDARRAGERDRLLREARRGPAGRRRARPAPPGGGARSRGAPPASGSRCSSEAPNRNGKDRREPERHARRSHPAGDEGFRAGGRVGLIGNSPQLVKLALDEALAAGALLLGRRS